MKTTELICDQCNKVFYRRKSLRDWELRNGIGRSTFCSQKCCKLHRKPKIGKCKNCGKALNDFHNQKIFCSRSCSVTWNNLHKTRGTRVSKLEYYIQGVLIERYPNLEILFNDKKTIGSELDIYVPSLKVAFELNGIFHYEPIFGENQLGRIQQNDANKFQLCQAHLISLCVIDTSQQKHFKETTSQRYLQIIIDIIDTTISERKESNL